MDLVPNTPDGGECEEAPGDPPPSLPPPPPPDTRAEQQQQPASRYESQKRRDWNTFLQYLGSHRPPLSLARCSGVHVIEFLKYLDQFGKTRVHVATCGFFGRPAPPAPCACPLRQAWGSLDALIGRLRAAYEENGGGRSESNPFGARPVAIYLREVKESQAKARGVPYDKKRKRRCALPGAADAGEGGSSGGRGAEPASLSAAVDAAAGELISSSSAAAAAPPAPS